MFPECRKGQWPLSQGKKKGVGLGSAKVDIAVTSWSVRFVYSVVTGIAIGFGVWTEISRFTAHQVPTIFSQDSETEFTISQHLAFAQNPNFGAPYMWPAFANSVEANAQQAEIVHDRFHISKHLNEAVDQVRRSEHKLLKQAGDDRLKGSKHLWLFNPENLSEERWIEFETLKDQELKTSRAWAIKEQFRWLWEYRYAANARKFFDRWYGWAVRSQLKPIIKVAKMLKRHLDNILTYFRHGITNAKSEGFNSRIQSIKSQARGFRAFQNFRNRILFYCGKLDLLPSEITH